MAEKKEEQSPIAFAIPNKKAGMWLIKQLYSTAGEMLNKDDTRGYGEDVLWAMCLNDLLLDRTTARPFKTKEEMIKKLIRKV